MRDDLLLYYERELGFLRHMGAEFAGKYPKVAQRLLLESGKESDDPHVERLLEAFAFLAARVHLKVEDEFPEITEALLNIVYPHYLRPVPSMSIAEFHIDPEQGKLTSGLPIEAGAMLYSRPVQGAPCKFRTCYRTVLWPITVTAAEWRTPDRLQPAVKTSDAAFALRLELRGEGDAKFSKLDLDSLRFYLHGEGSLIHAIYELLACNCVQILLRDPTPGSKVRPVALPPDSVRPTGFTEDESMLPYPRRSFTGYRLLQEYFTFPEKYFFLDLCNLQPALAQGFQDRLEIVFLVSEFERSERRQTLETRTSEKTFRLGCAPIVNLFPQTCEPILMNQRRYEYAVTPDVRRPLAHEIFSIDEVVAINPQSHEVLKYQPFHSYRHAAVRDRQQTFWLARRRPSPRKGDDGTDMSLSMVDLSTRPVDPDSDTLTVRATCTNRDLPSRLPFGNENGDFELEGGTPVRKIIALRKPTSTLRPQLGNSAQWRLISHLSLNYLSIVEDGKEALQEILKLYNFTDTAHTEQQIKEGITSLTSRKHFARVISENGITFARGTRVELELDEEQFVGGGAYLFASVLEQFLGLYVSLNSFSQLVASSRQRREVIREWPPRAGRRILI